MTTTSAPDWRKIAPPPRLAQRPRDVRGFIIPFSVDDGTDHPDFRMTNPDRMRDLLARHACWLCGSALDYWKCFIGGPISVQNHLFTDGPMHEACAIYALRVCPFLASPNGRYTTTEAEAAAAEGAINEFVADNRPPVFGLAFCRDYETGVDPNGMLYLHAGRWRKILWYSHHGQMVRRQIFETTRYERKTPRYKRTRKGS